MILFNPLHYRIKFKLSYVAIDLLAKYIDTLIKFSFIHSMLTNFSNLRGKPKLVRKMGYFEKSGVTEIIASDGGEGNDFWFELSEGSKNRDSTVAISAETSHTL